LIWELADKKSIKIHRNLWNDAKQTAYKEYFQQLTAPVAFQAETNSIPKNNQFYISHLHCSEVYSRQNKKQVREIFETLAKLSIKTSSKNLSHLKDESEKMIESVLYGEFKWSSNKMIDFTIHLKNPYFNTINISYEAIGSALFRINFDFKITDKIKYKYWQIIVSNFSNKIKIRRNLFKRSFKFTRLNGDYQKKIELEKVENRLIKNAQALIRNISKGVFLNLYNFVPTLLCGNYESIDYFINPLGKGKIVLSNLQNQEYDFYNSVLKISPAHKEIFINRHNNSLFIPDLNNSSEIQNIYAKHFTPRAYSYSPDELFWFNIKMSLFKMQYRLTKEIENTYLFKTLHQKRSPIVKLRKELTKIEALLAFFQESNEIEKSKLSWRFSNENRQYRDIRDKEREFYDYISRSIQFYEKDIQSKIPKLQNIYKLKNEDKNTRMNLWIQILLLLLTIATIVQTIHFQIQKRAPITAHGSSGCYIE
jgi:hypothetical protein